ncbi:MAG: prepilin-type N-terminal cleavage/methylation domain-containing protein, partial [Nitrospira sp.]|nr:prepilin-type N-terminal cleavage/methylation domain-containing protein [Nitrospira sp.]
MRLAESINSSRRQRGKRAFTLVELLVVIALIALLLTVMVPVILKFLKGRGLAMAGNNISGFFAYARAEALNSRLTHIIVMYPEQDEYATGGGGPPVKIGPGMGLFR